MSEPAAPDPYPGPRRTVADLAPALRLGLAGVMPAAWDPPAWLLPHQRIAARRLATALRVFGGALLCDAVGLGKSFVALALATRYPGAALVVPAAIRLQWRELSARYGLAPRLVTHEALSRGARLPAAALLIVDEAHRFRHPGTRRYDWLARQVGRADVLLVTATPVVNRAADLTALLRLFLSDRGLAALGVPSLEQAGVAAAVDDLGAAVAPLVVTRSPETARPPVPLPQLRGCRVIRAPSLEAGLLTACIRAISGLSFPTFGPDAGPLLSRHLLARLASSPEACAESVRRHRAYLERARDAAGRGQRLSRAAARALFGPDDAGQLELVLDQAAPLAPERSSVVAELDRLARLADLVGACGPSPKLRRCLALLDRRKGRKTIVFTAARATGRALAAALDWRHVALVSGGRAEIASGRLPVGQTLALFAPRAQGCAAPLPVLRLDTLIATDVASEGVNLQDADGVVHYDLPWTPLGLEQRVGRARRLGSAHHAVRVWWFAPPDPLERRLHLIRRIASKATVQLDLATPRTATVGRVGVVGGALERREQLLDGPAAPVRGHAVVAALDGAVAMVRLRGVRGDVFRLLSDGPAGLPLEAVARALTARDAPEDAPVPPSGWIAPRLRALVALADAPPRNPSTRSLARAIAGRAREASRGRALRLLDVLDRALQLVLSGLTAGAERELADVLTRPAAASLATWCEKWAGREPGLGGPEVLAVQLPSGESSGYIRVHGDQRPRISASASGARDYPTTC